MSALDLESGQPTRCRAYIGSTVLAIAATIAFRRPTSIGSAEAAVMIAASQYGIHTGIMDGLLHRLSRLVIGTQVVVGMRPMPP